MTNTEHWLQQFASGARDLAFPVTLPLAADLGELVILEQLRLLPGQRLVARGRLANRAVVVKLYLGDKAARHHARELAGAQALQDSGVPSAELVAQGGLSTEPRMRFILYTELAAISVAEHPTLDVFQQVVNCVAQMHNANLVQTDMHLGNFMHSADRVYAIDADGVRRSLSLPRTNAMDNLAVLFAQRSPATQRQELSAWIQTYASARNWQSVDQELIRELVLRTQRQRARRVRRYLQKTSRDCTEFFVQESQGQRFVAVRSALTESLLAFADDPELVVSGGESIKRGNTATVVRATLADRAVIIKRYNIKHRRHQVSQSLRLRSRAARAWRNGLLLRFLRIPTAEPLALLETKRGALRSTAYLIQEDLGSTDLLQRIQSPADVAQFAPQLQNLFLTLDQVGLVHGDTKATNFIVRHDQLYLVDLDSLQRGPAWQTGHRQLASPAVAKDQRRFLRNWESNPPVHEALVALMQQINAAAAE